MQAIRQLMAAAGVAGMVAAGMAYPAAQAAQARPADATGQCKDGTYTTAKAKRGACGGHGGVATWFADAKTPAKAAKDDAKAAGAATKDAAKDAGKAAKEGAKTVGKATKEGAAAAKDSTKTVARPAAAPADATGQCKDGSYTKATQHRGACSGHGGVAEWYK